MAKDSLQNEEMDKITSLTLEKRFLTQEFLLWLWYLSETQVMPLKFTEPKITVWVDNRLTLTSFRVDDYETIFRGGLPSRSPEAIFGLREGKRVKELRLGLSLPNGDEYTVCLYSVDLTIRSLVLPCESKKRKESDDAIAEEIGDLSAQRLTEIRQFMVIFEQLVETFVNLRSSSAWENEAMGAMGAWIHKRGAQSSTVLH